MATIVDTLETVLAFRVTGLSGSVSQVDRALSGLQRSGQLFGAAALAGGAGIGVLINKAAGFEQISVGFTSLLGSATAASNELKKLQDFAQRTPFNFDELAKSSQLLLGAGASADQLIPILNALGTATAASGKGQESLNRAILATSQIITKGKLQGDELLQLAEAGVPLNDVLKELGVSYDEVGKKGITATQFTTALIKVMGQGRFAGALAAQSNTLAGSWSNLQDATDRLSISLGTGLLPAATTVVKAVTNVVDAVNGLPEPVKNAAGMVGGVLVTGAIVAWGWLKALELQNIQLMNSMLRTADAAGAEALALQGLGTAAGTASVGTGAAGTAAGATPGGGIGGGFGKALQVLATAAAAEETGRAFQHAEGKAFGAPEGVDPVRFVANRNAARRGRPDLVTDPEMRKALGLDGGKPAAGQTDEQKMIELLQRQLDELQGIRKGQGQMASVSTSEVALYRQMAGRRAIQYSR